MYSRYAEIRDKVGMNDLQVADKAKIPPTTIYDWKQRSSSNPEASMSVANLMKIACALGCKLDDLIDNQG